mgnify:CR=1 FL=1
MEQFISTLEVTTFGEGFLDITNEINQLIKKNNISKGILILSSMHTSCSLIVNENADPNVLKDLQKYIQAIVPNNSYRDLSNNKKEIFYDHYQEGEDDMPAHIKTALTNTSLSLSILDNKLTLGTWQAIYLWEHRFGRKKRTLKIHIIGEKTKTIYN